MRGGHARPRQTAPAPVPHRERRKDPDAGRGHLGLQAKRQGRRPGRGETCHPARDRRSAGGDRSVRGRRRRDRAAPERTKVISCRHDRNDACRGGSLDRPDQEVAAGGDLGLTPREVDHVHPVADGSLDAGGDLRRVAVEPNVRSRRDGQHSVVAQVRARGHAGEGHRAAAERRLGVRVPRGDSGDVGAVLGLLRVERHVRVARPWGGRLEGSRDDHLGGRVRRLPLGEAGWHREAGRIEERMPLVDPVVDDPDLRSLTARRELGPPERRCADRRDAAVEARAQVGTRMDLTNTRNPLESFDRSARNEHRQRIQDDSVSPADLGAGHGCGDARFDDLLLGRHATQPAPARRRVRVET